MSFKCVRLLILKHSRTLSTSKKNFFFFVPGNIIFNLTVENKCIFIDKCDICTTTTIGCNMPHIPTYDKKKIMEMKKKNF